jgi:hypothetical protein
MSPDFKAFVPIEIVGSAAGTTVTKTLVVVTRVATETDTETTNTEPTSRESEVLTLRKFDVWEALRVNPHEEELEMGTFCRHLQRKNNFEEEFWGQPFTELGS